LLRICVAAEIGDKTKDLVDVTVVQNRFLESEIEESPPIIDVGEQFLAGSLAKRCHRRAT
jgi:hypothetical protein